MAPNELIPKASRFQSMASVCIVVAALYFGREVLIPLALALLLSFLLSPVVHRVEQFRISRVLSVVLVVLLSFLLIGVVGWLISSQISDLAGKLPSYEGQIRSRIASIQNRLG